MAFEPGDAAWTVHGRIASASNATLLVEILGVLHVYKPVDGEAPLWDFPSGSLGLRELAVAAIDAQLGWGLVPPTRWSDDGPHGPGMVQLWVDHDPADSPVRVCPPDDVPPGWMTVATGHDPAGRPLAVAHEDSAALLRLAVLDAVVNNADRKGGHILRGADGRIWGIDHGICLHEEPKLRTVLWGFAGRLLPPGIRADLARLADLAGEGFRAAPAVAAGIGAGERAALTRRVERLLAQQTLPGPMPGRPALPWPPI